MLKRRNKKKLTVGQLIAFIVVFAVFFLFAVTLIYPMLWALLNSFKTNAEYFDDPFKFPEIWQFKNYVKVFDKLSVRTSYGTQVGLLGMFANSIWLSLCGSVLTVFSSTMVAYVVAKYDFRMKNFIYGLAIFIMIIPIVGNLPAQYKLYSDLHLRNSPLILITYTGGFGFNFIVLYGFFKNVSWSYAEAAFVDGAKNLRVFLSIMLPLAMPAIAALFVIQVVGLWNDYMTPLMYLGDFPTLSSGLYRFKTIMESGGSTDYPVYFAGILLATIPILVLFAFFSETIMQNTVAGGLKG